MAQFDFAENSNIQFAQKEEIEGIKEIEQIQLDNTVIESTAVMTGDRDRSRFLYYQLKMSLKKARRVDIIVSFLMESGVRMILNDLKAALDRQNLVFRYFVYYVMLFTVLIFGIYGPEYDASAFIYFQF